MKPLPKAKTSVHFAKILDAPLLASPEKRNRSNMTAKHPILTINEIEKRFDAEWILLADPIADKSLEVRSGRVLFHGKDRDEVYREAIRLKPRRFAMLYTGRLPKGTAIVL